MSRTTVISEESKHFFLEKKKQKTFTHYWGRQIIVQNASTGAGAGTRNVDTVEHNSVDTHPPALRVFEQRVGRTKSANFSGYRDLIIGIASRLAVRR
jgi:hypothetical protein